jgi:cell division protein FtsL
VNKLVVVKKANHTKSNYSKSGYSDNNYINGNTVLAPQYDPSIDEEYLKSIKERKEKLKIENKKSIKRKFSILRNIVLVLIVGVVLVGRYSSIYNMQQQLNKTQNAISDLNRQNDSLKVSLVERGNVSEVQDIAVTKLNMVEPNRNVVIYTDLSKDNFNSDAQNTADKNNIIGKFIKALF